MGRATGWGNGEGGPWSSLVGVAIQEFDQNFYIWSGAQEKVDLLSGAGRLAGLVDLCALAAERAGVISPAGRNAFLRAHRSGNTAKHGPSRRAEVPSSQS